MPRIQKIGRDLSAAEWWDRRTAYYVGQIDAAYHEHRLKVVHRLLAALPLRGQVTLDVGCGEGVLLEHVARQGGQVIGFDLDRQMIEKAEERLARAGVTVGGLAVGGLERLETLPTASVDHVLSINTNHYFTDAEDAAFYRETHRILRPGGSLVITHSNRLFDLFTLNIFTVDTFAELLGCDITPLLTRPDAPAGKESYNVREIPWAYGAKLDWLGFREVQQEFIHYHAVPPLLAPPEEVAHETKYYRETLDWPPEERWKLALQCSQFGSRAVRV